MTSPAKRDFISLLDWSREELQRILDIAGRLKATMREGDRPPLLAGRTMAMIFEKPSLRTRTTFEIGMTQLGGYAVYLTPQDIRIGERESAADVARNLERMVDFIMARTFSHETLLELATHARVPVINGLSDLLHPCQAMADLLTVTEARGKLDGLRIVYVGDGNNVAHSWIHAAARFPFDLLIACPEGYAPRADLVERGRSEGARVEITHDPHAAAENADVVYTDVWASMGQESEAAERKRIFQPFQVNAGLMKRARSDAVFMHCLPAHRGEEVTDEVVDGPQSIVFDQAENRLHAQKAILVSLAGVEY